MVIAFTCSICTKAIGDNDNSLYCDRCNLWVYTKCKNLNFIDYQYLNGNDDPWFSLRCNSELFPFGTLNNKTFNQYINSRNMQNKNNDDDNSSNLFLKPLPNLNSLFNQFNKLMISNLWFQRPWKFYQVQILQSRKSSNDENS